MRQKGGGRLVAECSKWNFNLQGCSSNSRSAWNVFCVHISAKHQWSKVDVVVGWLKAREINTWELVAPSTHVVRSEARRQTSAVWVDAMANVASSLPLFLHRSSPSETQIAFLTITMGDDAMFMQVNSSNLLSPVVT
jgi:hypothetical protein